MAVDETASPRSDHRVLQPCCDLAPSDLAPLDGLTCFTSEVAGRHARLSLTLVARASRTRRLRGVPEEHSAFRDLLDGLTILGDDDFFRWTSR